MEMLSTGWIEKNIKSMMRRGGVDYLPRLVKVSFLGHEYMVRNGVVDEGDYDDAWMLALACHSRNVFDVGSNIGQSAFAMLHSPKVENVVLVDPSPLALTIAADTLIRNQMGHRARFVNAFVSNVTGEIVDFTAGYGTGGHRIKSGTGAAAASVRIPTYTVDDIAQLVGLSPDFVKFDVQGHEGKILEGSSHVASLRQTRFLIEMHRTPERRQEVTTQEVLDWCASNGYSAWYLSEHIRIDTVERVRHRGRYHLLLQPDGWEYPPWLASIPQKAPVEAGLNLAEA